MPLSCCKMQIYKKNKIQARSLLCFDALIVVNSLHCSLGRRVMLTAKRVSYLAAAMILGISQSASAAQAKEEDSVYQWGRWAVLSPAAGGAEPYAAVDTPGAEFNARPGDASEFQPEIASIEVPPIPPAGPPSVVPNPPGNPPPSGDPRGTPPPILSPPVVGTNPPGTPPPSGDPRGTPPPILTSPVVGTNPQVTVPPSGDPRGTPPPILVN
jgi:hypothetical protein